MTLPGTGCHRKNPASFYEIWAFKLRLVDKVEVAASTAVFDPITTMNPSNLDELHYTEQVLKGPAACAAAAEKPTTGRFTGTTGMVPRSFVPMLLDDPVAHLDKRSRCMAKSVSRCRNRVMVFRTSSSCSETTVLLV